MPSTQIKSLNGKEWYNLQATGVLNKEISRAIRKFTRL